MSRTWNNTTWGKWGVVTLYILLCVLYFAPIAAPYKLAYPLLFVTIASISSRQPLLMLALAFSAVGDLCGSIGELFFQIGAFGVAHLCYIVLLCKVARSRKHKLYTTMVALIIPITLCALAFIGIIPNISSQPLQIAVVVYAVAIGCMTFMAGLSGSCLVWIGAILFMASDFLLASSLFVAQLSHYIYLIPYFVGQLLLWLGLQNKYLAHQ